MWTKRLVFAVILAALMPASSAADVGPPAHLQVTERDGDVYALRWRVPKVLPVRALPVPDLPESCEPRGEPAITEQSGAWLFEQECRCESGLPGQLLGMDYPFPDLALTTVMRVDLLSGDRFAHVLTPGEGPWRIPQGTASTDLLAEARRALLAGAHHAATAWVHLAFLLVLGSLGTWRDPVRLVTAFTLGQLAAVIGLAAFGITLGGFAQGPAQIPLEEPNRARQVR